MITRTALLRRWLPGLMMTAATAAAGTPATALAQGAGDPSQAAAFIQQAGNQLAATVGGAATVEDKRQRLIPFLDQVVDVEGVGRFVLGRYWQTASPEQRAEYTRLFRTVLANGVATRLGDYRQGTVRVQTGRPEQRPDGIYVPTTVDRPGNPTARVTWVVVPAGNSFRITDVIAEGVSLRVTQRQDYASFLSRNGGNVGGLIQAMQGQIR